MRVGVFFRGTAVRRPARVADAVCAVHRLEPDDLFEVAQLALSAAHLQAFSVSGDSDARRVVPAILEAFQAIEDHRYNALPTDVSDDSTHKSASSSQKMPIQVGLRWARRDSEISVHPRESARRPYSSSLYENSSITGLVSTSRAMRSTSFCAAALSRPPFSVSSKYLPWRTSAMAACPIFLSAPWIVFPWGSSTVFLSETYT